MISAAARDWSSAGAEERAQCYSPLLDCLLAQYPQEEERQQVKVLVPGAGLGRLAWEIASKGFECQGNEFSLYMLFASNFILNKCPQVDGMKVSPYIHEFCNNLASRDQLREKIKLFFPGWLRLTDLVKGDCCLWSRRRD